MQGPLGDIQNQIGSVLNGAGYQPRPYHPLEDFAKGAAMGFAAALVWRLMKRRKLAKGEYTNPVFRFLGLLFGLPVLGFILSMVWIPETGWLFGSGCAFGFVLAVVYAVYRITGHGRYNSRRGDRPFMY